MINIGGDLLGQLKVPEAPTSLALLAPASSPASDTTPTIHIEGVGPGQLVKLFKDPQCNTIVGSDYATATSVDVTTIELLPGSYSFYATASNLELKTSKCSTALVSLTIFSHPTLVYANAFGVAGSYLSISPMTFKENSSPLTSCSTLPLLPSGLSIDNSTCEISGTPQAALTATTFTVTAVNEAGASTAQISIEITGNQPLISAPTLSYNPVSATVGSLFTLTPTTLLANGSAISSCTISPALPGGLSIHNTTCVISGTPLNVQPSTPYSVTVSNSAGSVSAVFNLAITASAPIFSYSGATGTTGKTSMTMSVSPTTLNARGAPVTNCVTSPALPSGLSINSSNCTIFGTPTVVLVATSFTVTATNSAGSASATVALTIADGTPAAPTSIVLYGDSSPTSDTTPSFEVGGIVTGQIIKLYTDANCSTQVASATATSAIVILTTSPLSPGNKMFYASASSGTPLLTSACSSVSSAVSIYAAPTISYATFSGTAGLVGAAMTVTPTLLSNNSAITSCTVTPALPTGLSLNMTTCQITGTPGAVLVSTSYAVTSSNSAGSTTATVNLSVAANTPSLIYPTAPATSGIVNVRMRLFPSTLNSRGAAITSCIISPALPLGFSINNTTCEISGTPLGVMSDTTFMVLVGNSVGVTTTTIVLRFLTNPCPVNYLYIPSNILAGTTAAFCVAKYEMKLVAGIATSQAADSPHVYISQIDSKAKCEELNSVNGVTNKYDLISNHEWMTIALDVENQASNWTGNNVGSGMMYVGHSDGTPAGPIAITDTNNPWDQTGNAATDTVTLGKEQKRTLNLSTGQTIWDFSGNVWEWVDWTTGGPLASGPGTCVENWTEFPLLSCAELSAIDYMPGNPAGVPLASYNSAYGVGQFYGGIGTSARRGGGYYNRIARVGPFSLDLDYTPSRTLPSSGYRCVFRP